MSDLKITKVEYRDVPGAGLQLYAYFTQEHNCVDFVLKPGYHLVTESSAIMGYEPWVQFEPEEYSKVMGELYKQLAEAWNEKYGAEQENV